MKLPILLFALGLCSQSSLIGQTTATASSVAMGYYTFDVPQGESAWVCGLVTKNDFQGEMTSFTGGAQSVITQTGASFPAFANHYVEIREGAWEGLALDIVSNTATTITVDGELGATGFNLTGDESYCIRAHVTLGTLLPDGSGLADNVDSVKLLFSNGSTEEFTFDGTNWRDESNAIADTVKVYPAQGIIITAAAARDIVIGGNEVSVVKSTPTIISVYDGQANLVGPVNPLVTTDVTDPLYPNNLPLGSDDGSTTEVENGIGIKDAFLAFADNVRVLSGDGNLVGTTYLYSGSTLIDGASGNADSATMPAGAAVAVTVGTAKYIKIPSFLEITTP